MQYRFVEIPFRFGFGNFQYWWPAFGLATVLLIGASIIFKYNPWGSEGTYQYYEEVRRPNYGISEKCDSDTMFDGDPSCFTAPDPEYAVWGDSFAKHLVPGLLSENPEIKLVQLTMSACGPVFGLAPVSLTDSNYGSDWADRCISFNQSVEEFIADSRSIHTIIMGSPFDYVHDGLTHRTPLGTIRLTEEELLTVFGDTIRRLRGFEKDVVIIAPPPAAYFNIGECVERQARGLLVFRGHGCNPNYKEYLEFRENSIQFLEKLSRLANVTVLWPSDVLCDQKECSATLNDKWVYGSGTHFSYEGSREFARVFDLFARIEQGAR